LLEDAKEAAKRPCFVRVTALEVAENLSCFCAIFPPMR